MKTSHILVVLSWLALSATTWANSFYVSTTGSSSGNGTVSNPWNLQTALNHPVSVVAGDTIFISEGTYKGHYTSKLTGTSAKPIRIMPYNQGKVVIDGNTGVSETTLTINGSNAIYSNFQVTNSDKKRNFLNNNVIVCSGIDVFGPNIKLINLLVYDNIGNGIGFWSSAIDSEIYGCIIFHNGYQDSSRGHGHGIYTQNATGTKQIRDNIIFNGFQYGVHAYTEEGNITGFNIEGNICFNNGVLQKSGELKSNVLVGGLQPANRVTIKNNHLLHPFAQTAKALELGYGPINETATVTGNILYGGNVTVKVNKWKNLTFTGNTVLSYGLLMELIVDGVDYKVYPWNNNRYFGNSTSTFSGLTYTNWKTTTGFDSQSTYTASLPSQNEVYIRPNQYQSGRATIVVYNWQKSSTVQVDLSSVLTSNAGYSIYDVQNINGPAIATGTFTGQKINLPMTLTAVAVPNGDVPNKPAHTDKDFGLFLVVSNSTSYPIPTPVPDTLEKPISIFLNPTEKLMTVDFGDSLPENADRILIYDITGKITQDRPLASTSALKTDIDLSSLTKGVYIVKIGRFTQKIIIAR
ncbi:MAG: T9SS type A sorting domain-containing protein [Breznakibacter sp.]